MVNRDLFKRYIAPSISWRSALLVAYCGTIMWSILNLGAARPFALSAVCSAMAVIALCALLLHGVTEKTETVVLIATAILASVLLWGYGQSGFLGLPRSLANTEISVQPSDTIFSLQYFAFPALTYIAGLMLLTSESTAQKLNLALIISSAIILAVTLVEFAVDPTRILLLDKAAYKDSFTATFINRNNAGTYIGLVTLLLVRQFWSSCRNLRSGDLLSIAFLWKRRSHTPILKAAGYAILLSIALIALFLTKSRAAIFSTLLALFVLSAILLWLRQKRQYTGRFLLRRYGFSLLLLLVTTGVAFLIFGERVMLRADTIGTEDPRFCVLPGMLNAARHYFSYGSGGGTFESVFAHYRDPACGLSGVWEKAHSTYLQTLIEFGLLGPIIGLTIVVGLFALFIHSLASKSRRNSYNALGLASVVLVSTHALVDFSIEIPGIAAFFSAILALATSIGYAHAPLKGLPSNEGNSEQLVSSQYK